MEILNKLKKSLEGDQWETPLDPALKSPLKKKTRAEYHWWDIHLIDYCIMILEINRLHNASYVVLNDKNNCYAVMCAIRKIMLFIQ